MFAVYIVSHFNFVMIFSLQVPLVAEILIREKHLKKRACISHNRPHEKDTVQKTHQKWFYEVSKRHPLSGTNIKQCNVV